MPEVGEYINSREKAYRWLLKTIPLNSHLTEEESIRLIRRVALEVGLSTKISQDIFRLMALVGLFESDLPAPLPKPKKTK